MMEMQTMLVSKQLGDLIDKLALHNAELAKLERRERFEASERQGKLTVNLVGTAVLQQDVDVDEFMVRARAAAAKEA